MKDDNKQSTELNLRQGINMQISISNLLQLILATLTVVAMGSPFGTNISKIILYIMSVNG